MGGPTLKNYVRHSIRFRILCCLLFSVALGLGLGWVSNAALRGLRLVPFTSQGEIGLIFFLGLFYTVLILMSLVSFMLRPIELLNQRMREGRASGNLRDIDPTEFFELGSLLQTTQDHLEKAQDQQNLTTAIHHAFRKRIEHLAEYDSLTGLYNRHYLNSVLPLQVAHAMNVKDQLSLIMLDVDHFKHYNDTCGHLEGDNVLARVAEILRNGVRTRDFCCRYGGEEFLVVLPNSSLERASTIAERIRRAIEDTPFTHEDKQPGGQVTASLGVATCPDHAPAADQLTECADQAMYLAKRLGRNRICTYTDVLQNPSGDAARAPRPPKAQVEAGTADPTADAETLR
jgi:diguanylate cyclase (GGDEF)-like protein